MLNELTKAHTGQPVTVSTARCRRLPRKRGVRVEEGGGAHPPPTPHATASTRPAPAPADFQFHTLRSIGPQRDATATSASRLTWPRRRSHLCCLPASRVLVVLPALARRRARSITGGGVRGRCALVLMWVSRFVWTPSECTECVGQRRQPNRQVTANDVG